MSEIVRRAGEHGTLVVVDNTFLSPALQKPLELGADIVVHSTTKFINGHSDVVGGVVVSASQATHDKLSWWANCLGVTGSPIDSFLVMRGLRTLHVRVNQQQANARSLAEYLARHEMVRRVYYPGLPSHVGHEVARSQQKGFGTMLSFEIDGGAEAAKAFVENVSLFSLAESLGGVESLLAHPATMTHLAMTPDARQAAGISDSLLRLSVGLEASHDLIADLERGLLAAAAG
jgi:cystathionine gamma-synthase